MPIPAETLNAQLLAREVHTGVYQNYARRIAIVVKVSKEGRVHYLHLEGNSSIVLESATSADFIKEYFIELYHYPVRRAVRLYAGYVRKDNFAVSDDARKVINAILVR